MLAWPSSELVYTLATQVAASLYVRASGNELLDYLRALEPAARDELTNSASEDVQDAIRAFVQRLIGKLFLGLYSQLWLLLTLV